MMLCKLSLSNIKKSFKDYAIYFITLILGVCIFYIFNSIDSQTAMMKVSNSQSEMIELLIEILSYVSIFVSCILGFLIIYASRFLIKKRNKEFGIYLTLGMSKRKVSILLLIETFIIGLLSLGIGLVLGILLSQVTSVFIASMFEANMTKFAFNFSKAALLKTILYFGIIYLIVMVFNTVIVNKNKLIDLLHASKKGEKIKLKNPVVCMILFIISIAMLSVAYYMVTGGIEELLEHDFSIIAIPIGLGILGTIIFFYSFAGMLLRILSKCHNLYSKKLNAFTFKQISSKVNTMVISVSIICIMLFFTLCLLSSAFTIKNFFNNSLFKNAPCDYQIEFWGVEYDLTEEYVYNKLNVLNDIKNSINIDVYRSEDFTYKESLGLYYETLKEKYPYVIYDEKVDIISIIDYNKLASIYDFEKVKLSNNEYFFVSNYEKEIYDEVMKLGSTMNISGTVLKPLQDKAIEGFIEMGGNPTNVGFIVVPDNEVTGEIYSQVFIGNYKEVTEEEKQVLEKKLKKVNFLFEDDPGSEDYGYSLNTKIDIKEASTGLSAIITFIGLYIGTIFLISSSAIMSLKELSDCLDDKNKYKVLRQIGTDEKEINKSLFKQTLIFFMMPLILALVHTIFGFKFCSWILSSLGVDNMLNGTIVTVLFLIGIYGLYFIITYLCNKNIIKKSN